MKAVGVDPGIKSGAMVVLDIDELGTARVCSVVRCARGALWPRTMKAACVDLAADVGAVERFIKVKGSNPNQGASIASRRMLKPCCGLVLSPSPVTWRIALGAGRMNRRKAKQWAMSRVEAMGWTAQDDHVAEAALLAVYASVVGAGLLVDSITA